MTQGELAELISYTEKSISKWESNTGMPDVITLLKISDVLDVTVDDLLYRRDERRYYLGIDGGASKTVFLLSDGDMNTVNRVELGPTNPNDIGMEAVQTTLRSGIEQVTKGYPMSKITMFAGISGGGISGRREILTDFFSKFGFKRFENNSDIGNVVRLGIPDRRGMVVIMGTGIVAYVIDGERERRIAGWGQFFDRGGSGYDIGRCGITAALASIDGTGEETILREMIERRIGTSIVEGLATFYQRGKQYIASFCREVYDAYRLGDKVAIEVIEQNIGAVARILESGRKFAGISPLRVAFAGSLSKDEDILFSVLGKFIDLRSYVLESLRDEPVMGALELARELDELPCELR